MRRLTISNSRLCAQKGRRFQCVVCGADRERLTPTQKVCTAEDNANCACVRAQWRREHRKRQSRKWYEEHRTSLLAAPRRPRDPKLDPEDMKREYESGSSLNDIGRKYGVSSETIRGILVRNGVARR